MAANSDAAVNAQRLAELASLVDAVKDRVRAQYPESTGNGATGAISVGLPDLTPLARARDAAAGKMAAIGTVNPRAGGVVNSGIQTVKRTVARALNWFVRDQVIFNRQMIACMETCIETIAEVNRSIHSLAGQTNTQVQLVRAESEPLRAEALTLRTKTSELQDLAAHWARWREEWQLKLHRNEVEFLKSATDLNTAFYQKLAYSEAAFHRRVEDLQQQFQKTAAELDASYSRTAKELEAACQQTALRIEASVAANFEQRAAEIEGSLQKQHEAFQRLSNDSTSAYLKVLADSINDVQKKFYSDVEGIRTEYERMIHAELRVVRQRIAAGAAPAATPVKPAEAAAAPPFDYARFAERFRGSEEHVIASQRFYIPFFAGRRRVLDVGCGRGEFLRLMKEEGIPAKGIEASEESVAYCRSLGLDATNADLFTYLGEQTESSLDGIFCSQVVEHLQADRLPEMVRLCASRLATGGILAIETPNPECLAIFATHFYLDPTHTRPVPSQLVAFYMEEFGMGRVEVHQRAPAMETMPEVGSLPADFRERFFGGLDYAILGYKL
ncbi:MAG TPA: methyltransferase domain-containing protein [Bryobacteraceae bacterium]